VVLEGVSLVLLVTVLAAVVVKIGISAAPLHLPGTSAGSTASGMVLAILSYVGFESAACMGREARDGRRSIPRAVLWSAIIAGILFVVSSYVQLAGFGSTAKLTASAAPLNDLADAAGVRFMGYLLDAGVVASFFACVTGSINAASRLLHAMGQERMIHGSFGRAHPHWRTPHVGIFALSGATLILPVVLAAHGTPVLNIYAYAGTIGTFGYMICYILIAVATPVIARRHGAPILASVVVGGIAAAAMTYVLYRSVYPVQPAPYDVLPWIFLGFLAMAGLWYGIRGRTVRRPGISLEMAASDADVPDAA
jgi:amino acid transporter